MLLEGFGQISSRTQNGCFTFGPLNTVFGHQDQVHNLLHLASSQRLPLSSDRPVRSWFFNTSMAIDGIRTQALTVLMTSTHGECWL